MYYFNKISYVLCLVFRDLYQVGRSILEEDLGEAGVGEELINIRLVADPGPPIRTARYLGQPIVETT